MAWGITGLGGHAYSLSISPAPPHLLAVGCGDKSIRVLPLPGALAPSPADPGAGASAELAPSEEEASVSAAEATGGSAAGQGGPEPQHAQQAQQAQQQKRPETPQQAPQQVQQAQQQRLVWQGIPDKITAVAWHPADPRLLAYGCHDGSVGLMRLGQGSPRVLAVRHKVGGWVGWNGPAPLSLEAAACARYLECKGMSLHCF